MDAETIVAELERLHVDTDGSLVAAPTRFYGKDNEGKSFRGYREGLYFRVEDMSKAAYFELQTQQILCARSRKLIVRVVPTHDPKKPDAPAWDYKTRRYKEINLQTLRSLLPPEHKDRFEHIWAEVQVFYPSTLVIEGEQRFFEDVKKP